MIKKLNLTRSLRVLDTASATNEMAQNNFIAQDKVNQIVSSQFRSFDFLPRIAAYLLNTKKDLGAEKSIQEFPDAPHAIWSIDNFGNCKTTILPHEIKFIPGTTLQTVLGNFTCYTHLRDVPDGNVGLIIGSSGLGAQRFLEIVIQGGNAAQKLGLHVGQHIL